MDIFGMQEFDHERVVFGHDAASGLHSIIAIHSTALGPAAGGCRMWPYRSTGEALTDVLRLSRGMSFKNALAGLPFGGGKAVILGNAQKGKSAELFQAYGRLVDSLGGAYITAEDVGTTLADMEQVARITRYVSGLGRAPGEAGGDPAPRTALGVFLGIQAAVKFRLGRADLQGTRVGVQGVGGVGYHLCALLSGAGAELLIADVRAEAIAPVRDEFRATVVPVDELLSQELDVLAPCALGAILNRASIAKLRTRVIAGAANNQLATDSDGAALLAAGVLYAPDYVINAGGIISVAHEFRGNATEAQVIREIQAIPLRLTEIFERAERENRPTNEIADQMARERIRYGVRRLVA